MLAKFHLFIGGNLHPFGTSADDY